MDGVLLIGEHGEYPTNDKEQKLYPRFEMFLKITDVFRQSGRSVPVFNDKHLSWSWRQAKRMVEISHELKFPMLAGSSVPVAWRVPAIDTPFGARQTHAVAISYSGLDIYGFHCARSACSVWWSGVRAAKRVFAPFNASRNRTAGISLSRTAGRRSSSMSRLLAAIRKRPGIHAIW